MSIPACEVSLRNSKNQAWSRAIVLLSVLPLAGCIASAPGSGGKQTQILVTVSPSTQPPLSVPVSTARRGDRHQQYRRDLGPKLGP